MPKPDENLTPLWRLTQEMNVLRLPEALPRTIYLERPRKRTASDADLYYCEPPKKSANKGSKSKL